MATTPQAAAAKWEQNLSAAATNGTIAAGIAAVTVAPGQAAARQADQYLAGVQANVNKWKTNVANVSLQSWQNAATNKGVGRIAQGAQQAQPNFANFMTQLMQYQSTGLAQLPQRGNLTQNIQRMTNWVQYMAKFSYNKSAS